MWLSFKLRDGRIGVCHEADVKSAAADPAHSFAKVQFRDGVEDEIIDAQGHYTLAEALAVMFSAMAPNVPCGECHLRPGETCDVCKAKDPREPDGFPAPTGDGTADLQRIDAHLARTAAGGLSAAEANELHDKADAPAPTAAEKLAALPETRQLPIAHGQGLSPLQDGNHPEIEAHRQRLSEAAGDPMASAKALLARKDAKT